MFFKFLASWKSLKKNKKNSETLTHSVSEIKSAPCEWQLLTEIDILVSSTVDSFSQQWPRLLVPAAPGLGPQDFQTPGTPSFQAAGFPGCRSAATQDASWSKSLEDLRFPAPGKSTWWCCPRTVVPGSPSQDLFAPRSMAGNLEVLWALVICMAGLSWSSLPWKPRFPSWLVTG